MILKMLFAQRAERYKGQYAPEALYVVDEYTHGETPEALEQAIMRFKKELGDDVVSLKVIDVEVDQEQIRNILSYMPLIKGNVKA